jgi:MoaA/NifB/PqqE/SkfB family radical SAM enzyme
MVWYSAETDLIAVRDGTSLAVRGADIDAELTGTLADDFLEAFVATPGANGGADGGRLAVLGALGTAEHRTLLETARRGGGRAWTPLDSVDGPSVLFLEVIGRCNERCVHCYADSSPQNGAALDQETCLRVISEGAALGFQWLQLTGGDPLLCPFLEDLVRAAKAAGFRGVEVYTNGLALDARRVARLAVAGAAFAFSFYSHDAPTHDAITGVPGSQGRTRAAIAAAVASGCEVRASIVVLEANAAHVEDTRALLQSLGVAPEAIGVDGVRQVGRGLGLHSVGGPALPSAGVHLGARSVRDARAERRGIHSPGKLCVSYTGQVFPCIFARFLPLGDVAHESLDAIVERTRSGCSDSCHGFDRLNRRLACFDCQLTAFALGAES